MPLPPCTSMQLMRAGDVTAEAKAASANRLLQTIATPAWSLWMVWTLISPGMFAYSTLMLRWGVRYSVTALDVADTKAYSMLRWGMRYSVTALDLADDVFFMFFY